MEPDSWQYHPPLIFVTTITEFAEFLNAKYDTRGEVNSTFAMSVFPSSVITWIQAQGERIAAHVKLSSSESLVEEAFFKMPRLDLATSIMICDDCKDRSTRGLALVGSENILRHICLEVNHYYKPCQAIRLDEGACAAAASLVSCLGLDPKTTTFKEMDERDARFLCGNCVSETSRGITGMKVYTWMECVRILSSSAQFRWYQFTCRQLLHFVTMGLHNDVIHTNPAWLLLSPEATRFVREHEHPYPRPFHQIWRCDHCNAHYSRPVTQDQGVSHVKSA